MVEFELKGPITSETAVSEAIGFILTLSVVLLASGIVYSSGLPILQDSMKQTHLLEMEESFTLLSQNINEVAYERAPLRTTEMKILGGSIGINQDSITKNSHMDIIINGTRSTFPMGTIEYYLEGRTIAYENGGVWVQYNNGVVVMKSKPHFNYANVTTIPVVTLLGEFTVGGEGVVRIRSKRSETSSTSFFNATGFNTTIIINSTYYEAWRTYLEDDLGATDIIMDNTNHTVSANLSAPKIFVDSNRLEMEIY